jgi:N-acetylneuraminic acid mutarotase
MPVAVTHAGQAADGGAVYLAGGFVGNHPGPSTSNVWRYDTQGDTWTAAPDLPADRGGGALVRLGRTLHFFGGATRPGGTNVLTDFNDHWTLDLGPTDAIADDASEWVPAAPLPNPRNHLGGAALGGLVYAVGGQHGGDEIAGNQSSVHAYDPSTGVWTEVAGLPVPIGHVASSTFVAGNRIVTAGGVTQNSTEVDDVFAYDPITDAWSALTSLPKNLQSPVADVVQDTIVVTNGGSSGLNSSTWTSPS